MIAKRTSFRHPTNEYELISTLSIYLSTPPFREERGDNVGGPFGSFAHPPTRRSCASVVAIVGTFLLRSCSLSGTSASPSVLAYVPVVAPHLLFDVRRPPLVACPPLCSWFSGHPADRNTCLPCHAAGHDGSKLQIDMTFRG